VGWVLAKNAAIVQRANLIRHSTAAISRPGVPQQVLDALHAAIIQAQPVHLLATDFGQQKDCPPGGEENPSDPQHARRLELNRHKNRADVPADSQYVSLTWSQSKTIP